jgi:endoglucanase
MLMPGATALFVHGPDWTVNPSYLPLFLFARFNAVDPAGPWPAIARNIPRLLRESARQGFAMDWVNYEADDGFVPAPAPGQNPSPASAAGRASAPQTTSGADPANQSAPQAAAADPLVAQQPGLGKASPPTIPPKPPMGSYDAIRVYLWAGMTSPAHGARDQLVAADAAMGEYLSRHDVPPEEVNADGVPQPQPGPIGFSAALLPYLGATSGLARAAAQQRARMSEQLNGTNGLYGKVPAYYDQNLVLFATGFLDGRFSFGSDGELKVEWKR